MRATVRRISLWIWLIAATANAQQIQFAEPVQLDVGTSSASFEAYGRQFSLALGDNERVLEKLPAQRKQELQRYRLMRGTLQGQPGSWVRLTESAAGIEGAIWDGHDLYAVTTYERIAALLTTPLEVRPDQTVVYRLSDARDLLPQNFCALDASAGVAKQSALDQYRALVADLESTADANITQQIEIALLADSDFAASQGADPTAVMLARLNIVEGIFSEQVGLLVLATDVRVMPAASDPFTSKNGTTLLEQLGKYRVATAAVRARGLAHLMTGKDLDGTTAGIAYVDTLCEGSRGVSLSGQSYGTTISALVMAHELGHNFGAPHDGASGGACQTVSGGFIMSPSVTGYATFSHCSLEVMRSALASASCVAPAEYADASVAPAANNLKVDTGVPFVLPWTVRAAGTSAAQDVLLEVMLPEGAGFSIDTISADQGSCSVAGTGASCTFGNLSPGEQRSVSLTARGTVAGSFSARAHVSALNDQLTSNNSRELAFSVRSGIDAAVTLSAETPEVALGAPLQFYADIRSLRSLAVRDAVLSLNLNQAVVAASLPGASCVPKARSVVCTLAELPAGESRRLTVSTNTIEPGPLYAAATVSAAGDGDLTNNSAYVQGWVQAERDLELTAGPASVELAVGGSYEVPLLVRARGPHPTGPARLSIDFSSATVAVELIDSEGATCTRPDAARIECELGVLAPGATQLVRLRASGSRSGLADISAMAEAADDGYVVNNFASVQLWVDNPVDLGVLLASGGAGVEGADLWGEVTLSSGGREPAVGATLDIELHAAGVLRGAAIHEGDECELLTAQRARCALPVLEGGAELYVKYRANFAEPGAYDVKFTLHTPGDTAAANDTLTRGILVRPYNDIAVSGDLDLTRLMAGETREASFVVRTGRRALASARFVASHYLPGIRVTTIRATTGDCQVDDSAGAACEFANLPADSELTVTVGWRAEEAAEADVSVDVTTTGDIAMGNNTVRGRAEVMGPTDLELRVASAANATAGATFDFPAISVVNGAQKAFGTRLEVTLPADVALVSMSASNAICSGSTVLRCDFDEIDAHGTATVNLTVRASQRGTHMSSLKLTSANDINPANDSREVAVEISGSAGVASASSSRGGGGAIEWLSLALLAVLVWRRQKMGTFLFSRPLARSCLVPPVRKSGMSPFIGYSASLLLTKATCMPSGDQDGTLMVPWPPYT
ncbi:MAG TPA: M12 family metallo-peptidase [Steroidobacteraceae bacterium]|nr:M12 family metallo-peptidase [Steroidobacteraceae bacterium]